MTSSSCWSVRGPPPPAPQAGITPLRPKLRVWSTSSSEKRDSTVLSAGAFQETCATNSPDSLVMAVLTDAPAPSGP